MRQVPKKLVLNKKADPPKSEIKGLISIISILVIVIIILGLFAPNLISLFLRHKNLIKITKVLFFINGSSFTILNGFNATPNSIANYTLNIANPTNYNMTLNSFGIETSNFSLFAVTPDIPKNITPYNSVNFTLQIKVPSNYTGSLTIVEFEKEDNPPYYKTYKYQEISIATDSELGILSRTNKQSLLAILTPQNYENFVDNKPYKAITYWTFNTTNITIINNLTNGKYYIMLESNACNYTFSYLNVPISSLKEISTKGSSNFNLSNYSSVDFEVLSTLPVGIYLNASLSRESTLLSPIRLNYTNIWRYLNRGNYTILLNSSAQSEALIALNKSILLVNPFYNLYLNRTTASIPIGISSYGLYDNLSHTNTYQISTNEVVGIANITSISAYNSTSPPNISKYGAGLQLNAVMNTNQQGKLHVYWLQDVVRFNTSNNNFYLLDNIWNYSLPNANMIRGSIEGNGNISIYSTQNKANYGYPYPRYWLNYSLPFSVKLVIQTHKTYAGMVVSFGYQLLKNDYCVQQSYRCSYYGRLENDTVQQIIFYDNVTIPNSTNATLLTTPYYNTPANATGFGHYYDTELVFGGEGSGENTSFSYTNAKLALYYSNNGVLNQFPSAYTFGRDTEEGTYNLQTSLNQNGTALVTIGNLNLFSSITTQYNTYSLLNLSYLK